MHVLSGSRFDLIDGGYVPTVKDIAQGLVGIPRWAGATIRRWTVLHHSLAVCDLIDAEHDDPALLLHGLWHDAAEFATGDIPSPHKTTEQRWHEQKIMGLLYEKTLRVRPPSEGEAAQVKNFDDRIKWAEARCLAHPRVWEDFAAEGQTFDWSAVTVVWNLLEYPDWVLRDRFVEDMKHLLTLVPRGRG